jgi:hypothetical protein
MPNKGVSLIWLLRNFVDKNLSLVCFQFIIHTQVPNSIYIQLPALLYCSPGTSCSPVKPGYFGRRLILGYWRIPSDPIQRTSTRLSFQGQRGQTSNGRIWKPNTIVSYSLIRQLCTPRPRRSQRHGGLTIHRHRLYMPSRAQILLAGDSDPIQASISWKSRLGATRMHIRLR